MVEKQGYIKSIINDSELKTPEHDELCLKFSSNYEKLIEYILENKKKNAIKTANEYLNLQQLGKPYYVQYEPKIDRINEQIELISINKKIQIEWEKPIKASNGFLIGFSDFLITGFFEFNVKVKGIEKKQILVSDPKDYLRKKYTEETMPFEKTIHKGDIENFWVFVEVKPKIKSLGELIRQLNLYKSYSGGSNSNFFVVVSKDIPDDFKKVLISQKIYVIDMNKIDNEGTQNGQTSP